MFKLATYAARKGEAMELVQRGFWSGLIANSVMTLGGMQNFQLLPRAQRSPLPPATITSDLLKTGGFEHRLPAEGRQAASLVAHYGYGAAFALIYAALAQNVKAPAAAKGAGFGLFVWGFSYLGLLPGLGVRSQAFNMPGSRNAMMVFLHLIWGASLGYSEEKLRTQGREMFDGRMKRPLAE